MAHSLVTILTPNSSAMTPAPLTSAGTEISRPARRKKNGVSRAKAMVRIRSTMTRSRRNSPATTSPTREAGRTASLFAALASPPRPNSTRNKNLISGSLTRPPTVRSTTRVRAGMNHIAARGDHDEDREQPVEVREQPAQGEHGAQVGDEAGGQDHLAEVGPVEPGLDHHGVDDRDRGRTQCDAGDLGRVRGPAQHQPAEQQRADERGDETDDPDAEAYPPVPAQADRVDLGPGEKG